MNVYGEAARYIRERGWRQGDGWGPNGECCIALAMEAACRAAGPPLSLLPLFGLADRLGFGDDPLSAVLAWNDAPERTVDEVLAVLDELAREAA